MFFGYKVLVRINDKNDIIEVNSSAFVKDNTNWIKIDEGASDRFHHAQNNYFSKPIMDDRSIYRYRLIDGIVVEKSQEEMDSEYITPVEVPSQLDAIEAQVTYSAMMTDTLL